VWPLRLAFLDVDQQRILFNDDDDIIRCLMKNSLPKRLMSAVEESRLPGSAKYYRNDEIFVIGFLI
jgi:hypothetical protein